jgi:hypothetical protein
MEVSGSWPSLPQARPVAVTDPEDTIAESVVSISTYETVTSTTVENLSASHNGRLSMSLL